MSTFLWFNIQLIGRCSRSYGFSMINTKIVNLCQTDYHCRSLLQRDTTRNSWSQYSPTLRPDSKCALYVDSKLRMVIVVRIFRTSHTTRKRCCHVLWIYIRVVAKEMKMIMQYTIFQSWIQWTAFERQTIRSRTRIRDGNVKKPIVGITDGLTIQSKLSFSCTQIFRWSNTTQFTFFDCRSMNPYKDTINRPSTFRETCAGFLLESIGNPHLLFPRRGVWYMEVFNLVDRIHNKPYTPEDFSVAHTIFTHDVVWRATRKVPNGASKSDCFCYHPVSDMPMVLWTLSNKSTQLWFKLLK